MYAHPDYVKEDLLRVPNINEESSDKNKPIFCRFCNQRFLLRHEKLLMIHTEQKHLKDVENILKATTSERCGNNKSKAQGQFENSTLEVRLAIALSGRIYQKYIFFKLMVSKTFYGFRQNSERPSASKRNI